MRPTCKRPFFSFTLLALTLYAYSLNKLGEAPEALSTTLRLIEFMTVPRSDGDCVVLLLVHPGPNLLARHFPPFKVNDFLLSELDGPCPDNQAADVFNEELSTVSGSTERTQDTQERLHGDLYDGVVLPVGDLDLDDIEKERYDVMDLASFLEYVIQDRYVATMKL